MVKLAVKVHKLVVGQFRNDLGITTRINRIGIVGKDRPLGLTHQERVGRRIDTLHLIVHDTLVGEWFLLIVEFQVPSLLCVDHGVRHSAGMKDSIGVDID